jgi:hypothetical protein
MREPPRQRSAGETEPDPEFDRALIRSLASSTAIETGERIPTLERDLRRLFGRERVRLAKSKR